MNSTIGPSRPNADRLADSSRRFQNVLNREQVRAEESQQSMSLVVFELEQPDEKALRRIMRALRRRSRLTDDIGRFDSNRLAAVLPSTPRAEAEAFARRISRIAEQRMLAIRWEVFTYPPGAQAASPDQKVDHPGELNKWLNGDGGYLDVQKLLGEPSRTPISRAERVLRQRERHVNPSAMIGRPLPLWKRTIDIVGSSIGLLILAPVMLVIALAIKLTSRGPVLFCQQRAGYCGKPFTIYKFRTMVIGADDRKADLKAQSEQDGPAFKMREDPRVTFVGKFLRMTSLDELPQFWNVLKGDMSLVGPRPLPIEEDAQCLPWQRRRLLVTPGLTCIWQVRGRCRVSFDEWMRMDLEYIQRRGFLYDLLLLVMTIPAVLLRRGAH